MNCFFEHDPLPCRLQAGQAFEGPSVEAGYSRMISSMLSSIRIVFVPLLLLTFVAARRRAQNAERRSQYSCLSLAGCC